MNTKMKQIFIILSIILIGLTPGCARQGETPAPTAAPTTTVPVTKPDVTTTPPPTPVAEPEEVKTANFVDSVPSHKEVFATVPEEVIINFDNVLGDTSKVTVYHEIDGKTHIASIETRPPETRMRGGSLMRTKLDPQYGDGKYTVKYRACQAGGADSTCTDGRYSFTVDSSTLNNNYADMTKKAYIEIKMAGNRFNPQNVIISRGTRVRWTNEEVTRHTVVSNPFKSQNYVLSLNSGLLSKYNNYEYTFTKTGEFPYHCSLHYSDGMVGRILVK